jgi:hypothetical protein
MNITLLLAALTLGAPAPKEAPKSPIVGTWLILTQTQEGNTTEVMGNECWTFTADGKRGGHKANTIPTDWQKYEVNEKRRPQSLVVIHEYRTRSHSQFFLFEIDGDMMTLCTNTRAEGLPESISAKKGSGNQILTFERIRAKD